MRRLFSTSFVLVALAARCADARTLAAQLHSFFDDNASIIHGAVTDTFTPVLERIAARGTALPATSSVPGFFYAFDFEAGTGMRQESPFGEMFVESPRTVGGRTLAVAGTYVHADLSDFDGHDLARQLRFSSTIPFSDGSRARTRLDFTDFALHLDVFSLVATYGVTDRWDVNALLPLVDSRLDVRARRFGRFDQPLTPPTILRDTVGLDAGAFGVGDVLLRTKYRLTATEGASSLAVGTTLRTPTAEERDFHGLGDWTVEPFVALGRAFGRGETHGTLGVEADADDWTRSRVHYAAGGSVQAARRVAFLLDVIGSSGIAQDRFEVRAGGIVARSGFLERFEDRPATGGPGPVRVSAFVPRTDVVDLSVGCRIRLGDHAAASLAVLTPLVRDGLRAAVIPAGGLEYTF